MAEGCIYIYTGDGRGKSPAAIGRAVQAAVEGKRVVIIQFLKGKGLGDSDFLRRMEPEIKLFQVMRVMKLMEAIFQAAETKQVIEFQDQV